MSQVLIDDDAATIEQIVAIARGFSRLELGDAAHERIQRGRAILDDHAARRAPVYGLNTGLGASVDTPLSDADLVSFQERVTDSHSVGVGPAHPIDQVRAMMAVRVARMARGGSGASQGVVTSIVAALNAGVHPVVPAWGSIGAADLAPLAQLGRVLLGSGEADVVTEADRPSMRVPAAQALAEAGLERVRFAAKDVHSLVVSNSLSVGLACLVLADLERTFTWSLRAAALDFEAFRSNTTSLADAALAARPAFGQREVGERLRALLTGGDLLESSAPRRLQDPLSYRCVPQVWGALLYAMRQAAEATQIELGSAGENPVVVLETQEVLSHGNFDLTAFVLTWESLGQALAHAAAGTAQRVMKLMSPVASELPRFLSAQGQNHAGMAMIQKAVSALEMEIRHLANPVSISPLAVSDGIEDQASMAPRVVGKVAEMLERFRHLVAIELLASATAFELRGVGRLGTGSEAAYRRVRAVSEPLVEDRALGGDITAVAAMVATED